MKFKFRNYNDVKFLQEGGPVDAPVEEAPVEEAPAEAPTQGGDPMQQLVEAFAQGLQNQDCQLLAQAAQMFLQMVSGGGQEAPAEAPGAPVYKKGGKLSHWVKK